MWMCPPQAKRSENKRRQGQRGGARRSERCASVHHGWAHRAKEVKGRSIQHKRKKLRTTKLKGRRTSEGAELPTPRQAGVRLLIATLVFTDHCMVRWPRRPPVCATTWSRLLGSSSTTRAAQASPHAQPKQGVEQADICRTRHATSPPWAAHRPVPAASKSRSPKNRSP